MHELAVTQSVLEMALRHATEAGGRRITDLHLVMGELSTNVDDSVQFYWDILAQGTAAEGAKLHFRRVAAELQCQSCKTKYHIAGGELACPECGSAGARILCWRGVSLEAIDVDGRVNSMTQRIPVVENILNANDRLAEENRRRLDAGRCLFDQPDGLAGRRQDVA